MLLGHLLLALGVALARNGVQAGRSRGSPTTTTPAPPPLPSPMDLTLALDRNTTPFEPAFAITKNQSSKGDFGWFATQSWCGSGQAGTHIEAPAHLHEQGWKVDDLPMDRLLVAGVLLDVSKDLPANASIAPIGPGVVVTAEHLVAWEKRHGAPPANTVLLIRFGWAAARRARNVSATPVAGLSRDAAAHLVSRGRYVGVGVDLPSVDAAPTAPMAPAAPLAHGREEPAARALLEAGLYTLLNLDLSQELPAKGFSLLVMPTKVRGVAVAPVRVVATTRSPSLSKSSASSPTPFAAILVAAAVLVNCVWAKRLYVAL